MYFILMEIKTWAQLSGSEQNNILQVMSSIFVVEGASESMAEYWYNNGYIRLIREDGYKRIIGKLGDEKDGYQRGKIQEESLYYEGKKHDGSLPLIGVNTFLPKEGQEDEVHELELIRSTETQKQDQIRHLRDFQSMHCDESAEALQRLQARARERGNLFAELMETVKTNSLSQISAALYDVGGEYRRNM